MAFTQYHEAALDAIATAPEGVLCLIKAEKEGKEEVLLAAIDVDLFSGGAKVYPLAKVLEQEELEGYTLAGASLEEE